MNYDLLLADGRIVRKRLEIFLGNIDQKLVENPELYFDLSGCDVNLLDIDMLIHTRVRVAGVRRAAEFMEKAAMGQHPKRKPLTVVKQEGDRFLIDDGNSTAVVARLAGWRCVPCVQVGASGTAVAPERGDHGCEERSGGA